MKKDMHPALGLVQFRCASCSNSWITSSTRMDGRKETVDGVEYPTLVLDTCSNCHPFFTDKQTFIDTTGRVEKFQKRFAKFSQSKQSKDEAKA